MPAMAIDFPQAHGGTGGRTMKKLLLGTLLGATSLLASGAVPGPAVAGPRTGAGQDASASSLHAFSTRTLEGQTVSLGIYRGRVLLVVNVASRCGLTPQYAGLETLHRELADSGFAVLGFPSNDFLEQEPGTPAEIRAFCDAEYGVTFPLFEKVKVKGEDKCPIYRFLTRDHPEPSWNFTKYLVDQDGHVVQRFDPRTPPDDPQLRAAIMKLLSAGR
jgi:glutathione peroxidase